jgi:hypothetical protein
MHLLSLRALRVVIEHDIFTPEQIQRVFSTYNNLEPDRQCSVVNVISTATQWYSLDPATARNAFEWVRAALRNATDPVLTGQLLGVVARLSELSPATVSFFARELVAPLSVAVASRLPAALAPTGDFMAKCALVYPPLLTRVFDSAFPALLNCARVDSASNSCHRAAIGESIAAIAKAVLPLRDLPIVVAIISKFLASTEAPLMTAGGNMLMQLAPTVTRSSLAELFPEVARAAAMASDERALNAICKSIRRVMYRTPVNPVVAAGLVSRILLRYHPFFEKVAIENWVSPETSIFSVVTITIEQYPEQIAPLIPWLEHMASQTPDAMFSTIFDSVAAAYGVGLVTTLPSQRLFDVCYDEIFSKHSTISLGYVLDTVGSAIGDLTAALSLEWRRIPSTELLWRAVVSDALLLLAGRHQKVDADILQTIVQEFPYKPEFGLAESLAKNIIRAWEVSPDMQEVELAILKSFSDLFLLEPAEFREFKIPLDLPSDMKAVMRRLMKKNKDYESEMVMYYAGQKAKINKFWVLL